jgi:quercetin dioxygenase-like cupin family protein
MRKTIFGVLAIVLGLVVVTPGVHAAKKAGTLIAAADLKWNDVPGFPGIKMAVVDGNPDKGASHFFIKFAPGFAAPEHHHSADHFVSVVAGNMTLGKDGKEVKLGPGSYFSFTGKQVHTTKCDAGADCLIFVDARAKWDVVVEKAAAPAGAKKTASGKEAAAPSK